MMQVTALKKSFGKTVVLRGIDLTVPDGKVIAVIGPSGSGKSTFLRCLDYLEKPDSGTITLDELVIQADQAHKKDVLALRRGTAMVFQQFNLFRGRTAKENVMEGLVQVKRLSEKEAGEAAEHYLSEVGLANRMNYYPRQLSGGQQQRVGIARALALEPKVILLDEPTSALDPEMIGEVLVVIGKQAKQGKTMLIVSHEMDFVREIADEVVFLDNGLVLEQGPPRDLFINPVHERTKQFLARVFQSFDYVI
ncbi:MAG: amino acid ABC transporter ATP-binding protein [Gracilibacteraceae bacterium]|nr:amino acid ABC transporter ATP-binding protein [Gracilibacteraceae bacterium]